MTKKKSKPTQASSKEKYHNDRAAQAEASPAVTKPSRQDVMSDVRAQREARYGKDIKSSNTPQGSPNGQPSSTPYGYVRKSTLCFSVFIALALGLMLGSLLPGLTNAPPHTPAPAQTKAQPEKQARQNEQKTAELASHILELEGAVRKNPNDVEAWIQLGNLYFDTGKAMQSINAYERALTLQPNNANVLTDLGIMYREAAQFELAVQSFRKAIQINPKHQNAMFNSGVVLYFDLQRKDEARKVWQELLDINPQAKAPDGKSLKDMMRNLK